MAPKRRTAGSKQGKDAILVIDVLNDLDFDGGENVLPWAIKLAKPLRAVCRRARRAGVPVIYVNDNCGLWNGDRESVYAHCTRRGARGREVARSLKPAASDYFILKPRHSAFFATPLLPLLQQLNVNRLVLAGMATNLCVLITAHDASMHGFPVTVLSNCCAAESDFDHNVVLRQLEKFFDATICLSTEVELRSPETR